MSVLWVGAAVSVVGGIANASAAKSAANKQADATREASATQAEAMDKQIALQREQFNRADQLAQPTIQAGNLARNRLLFGMGLSPNGTGGAPAAVGAPQTAPGAPPQAAPAAPAQLSREQLRAQLLGQYTTNAPAAQPSIAERPDLYQYTNSAESGGGENYRYLGGANTSTVDEAALNAAIEAQYAQQAQAAQQGGGAPAGQPTPEQLAAAQADPNYGSMLRNFSAQDAIDDPIYAQSRPIIDAAKERAMDVNKDGFYAQLKPALNDALARIQDPSKDPLTARMQPGINNALARIADPSTDAQTQQLQPLVNKALTRASGDFETSPGYAFRLAEGNKGVENSAAAKGGLYSGAALKAVGRYNQDFASNEYGNWLNQTNQDRSFVQGAGTDAYNRLVTDRNFVSGQNDSQYGRMNTDRNFVQGANNDAYGRQVTDRNYVASQADATYNRFNQNQTTQFNRLASVAGAGQTASGNVTTAGQNYAAGAGQAYQANANNQQALITNNANAQGAAGIAGTNALTGALSGAVGGIQQNQFLQQILSKNNSGSYGANNGFYFGNGTGGS